MKMIRIKPLILKNSKAEVIIRNLYAKGVSLKYNGKRLKQESACAIVAAGDSPVTTDLTISLLKRSGEI